MKKAKSRVPSSPGADVDGSPFGFEITIEDPDRKGRCLTAGSVLRGAVRVTAPSLSSAAPEAAATEPAARSTAVWKVRSLRLQLEGLEEHYVHKSSIRASIANGGDGAASAKVHGAVGDPTVHLWRTLTLVGTPAAEEREAEETQRLREQAFVQANSRGAPLTGVVLSVRGNGLAQESDAGLAHRAGDEDAFLQPDTIGYEEGCAMGTLTLRPGEGATLRFAVKLPPWLPPSLYYNTDDTAHGSIRYTVTALLDAGLEVPGGDSAASSAVLRHGEWRSSSKAFVLRSAVPRRQLLQCHERAGIKPIFTQTWRFRVRSQNVFTQMLNAGKVTVGSIEVTVKYVSSTALLLADPDDASSLAMRERWTNALTTGGSLVNSPTSPLLGPASHAADGNVDASAAVTAAGTTVMGTVVSGAGSTGVYLLRHVPATATPQSPSALSSPADRQGSPRGKKRGSMPQVPRAPIGELRLRVRVQNGSPYDTEKTLKKLPDVTCVRVELMEQVLLHKAPPGPRSGRVSQFDDPNILYSSEPIRLGYQDCMYKIKPGTSQNFEVVIALPPRFRRTRLVTSWKVRNTQGGKAIAGRDSTSSSSGSGSGSEGGDAAATSPEERNLGEAEDRPSSKGSPTTPVYSYGGAKHPPPPPSITTNHFTAITYLRVTLPSQQVIPEVEPDARNIIVLAEAVDETDTMPYLPVVTSV